MKDRSLMALGAAATLHLGVIAQVAIGGEVTPGYNTKIPPEIMTPDKVQHYINNTLAFV